MSLRDQTLSNVQKKANELAASILKCDTDFELYPEDIRFILTCRALGYGTISELSVHEGRPQVAKRVEERLRFNQEINFK